MDALEIAGRQDVGLPVTAAEADFLLRAKPRYCRGQVKAGVDLAAVNASILALGSAAPLQRTSRSPCPIHYNFNTYAGAQPLTGTPRAWTCPSDGVTGTYHGSRPVIAGGAASTIPSSIDGTGAIEVTNEAGTGALELWLKNEVPDGATIVGGAGARYLCNFPLIIDKRRGLTFEAADPANKPKLFQTNKTPYTVGTQAQIDAKNRTRRLTYWLEGGGHTVRNWIFEGPSPDAGTRNYIPTLEAQHAFEIAGVDGFLSEDCEVRYVEGDTFLLVQKSFGPTFPYIHPANITIRRLNAHHIGRQGLTPVDVHGCVLEDFTFDFIGRSGIDFEPDGYRQECLNVTIRRGEMRHIHSQWVSSAGETSARIEDVAIENINTYGCGLYGGMIGNTTVGEAPIPGQAPGRRRKNIRFADCHGYDPPVAGLSNPRIMRLRAIDGLELINLIQDPPLGPSRATAGLWLDEVCGVTYTGCDWGGLTLGPVHDHEVTTGYATVPVSIAQPVALLQQTIVVDPLPGPIPVNGVVVFGAQTRSLQLLQPAVAGATTLHTRRARWTFTPGEQGSYALPTTTYDGGNLEWAGRTDFWGCGYVPPPFP